VRPAHLAELDVAHVGAGALVVLFEYFGYGGEIEVVEFEEGVDVVGEGVECRLDLAEGLLAGGCGGGGGGGVFGGGCALYDGAEAVALDVGFGVFEARDGPFHFLSVEGLDYAEGLGVYFPEGGVGGRFLFVVGVHFGVGCGVAGGGDGGGGWSFGTVVVAADDAVVVVGTVGIIVAHGEGFGNRKGIGERIGVRIGHRFPDGGKFLLQEFVVYGVHLPVLLYRLFHRFAEFHPHYH